MAIEKATFGAGCFWGVEEAFASVDGVTKTTVGYMGGTKPATYKDVCTGKTGHAEVCQVEYNTDKVSYSDLLKVFWSIHDPTQINMQGPDVGTQYRSVIFFHTNEQKNIAEKSKQEQQKKIKNTITTDIVPAGTFYKAEDYHQQYFKKHGMKKCLSSLIFSFMK